MKESLSMSPEVLTDSKFEKKEERIIGILTLTRHSKTNYTEKYPDITEEGRLVAQKKAQKIKERNGNSSSGEDRFYTSSPNARALGTMDIIKEAMGDKDEPTHLSNSIRSMDVFDMAGAVEIFQELQGERRDPELVGKKYHSDERFEYRPEIIEPRSKVKKRAMRALEYLIRKLDAYAGQKTPHVFATSHFEVINPIVAEVFGLDAGEDDLFGHVEDVRIEFLEPEDSDIIPMRMYFRGEKRAVSFDRKTRRIIL